jgi:hypothetical protein
VKAVVEALIGLGFTLEEARQRVDLWVAQQLALEAQALAILPPDVRARETLRWALEATEVTDRLIHDSS